MDRKVLVPPAEPDRAEDIEAHREGSSDDTISKHAPRISNVKAAFKRMLGPQPLPACTALAGARGCDEVPRPQRWLPRFLRPYPTELPVNPVALRSSSVQRKLTAILLTDVQDYSRLMETDDEDTLRRLREYQEVIGRCIGEYRGRLVEAPGDALLAEFGSVVDAVGCAVEVQEELASRNAALPADHRMDFRAGVNLGDVIVDKESLYGDGVNIAARLEPLAEAGGICISGSVYDEVQNKLPLEWEYLGEQTLKNIAAPVRAYRLLTGSHVENRATDSSEESNLPEKPSIAVLPFDDMSGEPRQDGFADGITEDIITALSRFPQLIVIARNSTFTYKSKAVKVQDVARELGAQYVLEGSVRKGEDRVRVVAQLIDATTGNHLWAERYDRKLTDIFDLQEEVSQTIVATLPGRLEAAHPEHTRRKAPEKLAAYDYVLAAKLHHHRDSKNDNKEALRLLNKAIDLNPHFAQAYAWKAYTLGQAGARGYTKNPEVAIAQAREAITRALSLDEDDVECHRLVCEINMEWQEWDAAEFHHERAFTLNPNDPRSVAQKGELLTRLGRPVEGEKWVRKAMRLDPYGAHQYVHLLGRALYSARRYQEAVHVFQQIFTPDCGHHAALAACYAQMHMDCKARFHVSEVLRLKPKFSIARYMRGITFADRTHQEHCFEGLRKAGLPE